MVERLPPIRPRQIIGRVSGNGVLMTSEFMRWLDELRRGVDTQTVITTSVSGSVSTTYRMENFPTGPAATSYQSESADSAATAYETDPVQVATTEYS